MPEAKRATFNIENYKVSKFSFTEPPDNAPETLSMSFHPSGVLHPSTGKFIMNLKFQATLEDEEQHENDFQIVEVLFIATFKFEEALTLDEIPSYFYRNSLGIMFPYVRAFVSTLSFQANMNPIMLPLLNLTTLETYFKDNTTIAE